MRARNNFSGTTDFFWIRPGEAFDLRSDVLNSRAGSTVGDFPLEIYVLPSDCAQVPPRDLC